MSRRSMRQAQKSGLSRGMPLTTWNEIAWPRRA